MKKTKQATKEFLSGNEAVAFAARDAGIRFAAAYPGTPSTEIIDTISKFSENSGERDVIYSEWSINEKVSLEAAFGACYGGARALVAMKHVGLNIASDPLCTISYSGVNAGLVVVVCDDPGMHSSQNEQDSRHFARLANVPLLEAYDQQSAYDMTRLAFGLSEKYDTPIIVRLTTRICHSKSKVKLKKAEKPKLKSVPKNASKYVMMPVFARKRHPEVESRMEKMTKEAKEQLVYEKRKSKRLLITTGVCHDYCREFLKGDILNVSMSWPFPSVQVKSIAEKYTDIWVVEELGPFIKDEILKIGIKINKIFSSLGELTPNRLLGKSKPSTKYRRAPSMCKGCPHIPIFEVLKTLKTRVIGDIGCYTLAALPPLESMDTQLNMGLSVGAVHGLSKIRKPQNTVAVIGDSTFMHSGMTSLINSIYNKGISKILILDNDVTAMTGCQEYPGSGRINFTKICSVLGADSVFLIDPYDKELTQKTLRLHLNTPRLTVFITNRPCVKKTMKQQ
ncbi:indolepyruvate ferredoxin oxidoreductase subunit alpha [Candidatus Woesearchaeota archaeon]|nr:indolepyruvate ferredoxin oxidoreductase subunit alpha [Candidatus Woesearchaeota archaeon]